jgi:hypothetical protein
MDTLKAKLLMQIGSATLMSDGAGHLFLRDTLGNVHNLDSAGAGGGADSSIFLTIFRNDTAKANLRIEIAGLIDDSTKWNTVAGTVGADSAGWNTAAVRALNLVNDSTSWNTAYNRSTNLINDSTNWNTAYTGRVTTWSLPLSFSSNIASIDTSTNGTGLVSLAHLGTWAGSTNITTLGALTSGITINRSGAETYIIWQWTGTQFAQLRGESNYGLKVTSTGGSTVWFAVNSRGITVGSDTTLEGRGVSTTVDTVEASGRSANINSTNLLRTSTSAGYTIKYYLSCTTSDASGASVVVNFAWNDGAAKTYTSSSLAVASTANYVTGSIFVKNSSGSISYSTSVTGTPTTAKYLLDVCCERSD